MKSLRLHVVRVPPEAPVPERRIDGSGFRFPQPPEIREMAINDPVAGKAGGQRFLHELGVAPGGRDLSDVRELPDAVDLQKLDEFLRRTRGMTDCVDHK